MMRWLLVLLVGLLMFLQVKLWFGDGSLNEVYRLKKTIAEQKKTNDEALERNQALEGEVKDLKQGLDAIEERARSELGMVKENETFYQIVED